MQIVIDIEDSLYDAINTEFYINGMRSGKTLLQKFVNSVCNGTPLPKGHGRLIDADDLYNQTAEWEAQALAQVERYSPEYSREEWRWWSAVLKERGAFKRDLENAQTVLEADKE